MPLFAFCPSPAPSPAPAPPPWGCGATVTVDTVLENDVGPCPSGGIVIGDAVTHRGHPGPADVVPYILSSRDNRIFGNNVVNNGPFGGISLYSEVDGDHPRTTSGLSTGNVIDSNTVVDNRIGRNGTVAGTDNDGIRIEPGTPGNFILNNRVTGNGLDGIALFRRSADNVIRGNISSDNGLRTSARRGDGIRVFPGADRTVIEGNLTVRNGDNGIIVGSLDNRIEGNTSLFNQAFPPLNVNNPAVDLRDQNATCDNNVWLDNRYGTVNPPCAGDTP